MQTYKHELKVDFGGVTIGDHSAAVGLSFDRNGKHKLDAVDTMLCGKRLQVFCIVGDAADPSQQQLDGMEGEHRPHVEATCDSPSLRVTPKLFTGRLSFSLEEIDVADIAGIAKRRGTVRLNVLGPIPEKEQSENPRQQQLPPPAPEKLTDPTREAWANTPIDVLAKCAQGLPPAKLEALKESELEIGTIGKLTGTIETDPNWHRKVRGFGKKWIDRLTDCLAAFLEVNPAPEQDRDPEAEEPDPEVGGSGQQSGGPGGQSGGFPDRNGAGGEEVESISIRRKWHDEKLKAHVQVAVGPIEVGNDERFVSCLQYGIGTDEGGRHNPRVDSQPHATAAEAAVCALDELIQQWDRAGGNRKKAAALIAEWRDEVWPGHELQAGDADAPEDVPFGK